MKTLSIKSLNMTLTNVINKHKSDKILMIFDYMFLFFFIIVSPWLFSTIFVLIVGTQIALYIFIAFTLLLILLIIYLNLKWDDRM